MADTPSTKDPLAITIAIASLAVQLGLGLYWGGKIEQRLDDTEHRVDQIAISVHENSQKTSTHDTAIAVITQQLSDIKSTVDRIDRKTVGKGDKL